MNADTLRDLSPDELEAKSHELREQLQANILAMKLATTQSAFRDRVVEELSGELDLELPERLL